MIPPPGWCHPCHSQWTPRRWIGWLGTSFALLRTSGTTEVWSSPMAWRPCSSATRQQTSPPLLWTSISVTKVISSLLSWESYILTSQGHFEIRCGKYMHSVNIVYFWGYHLFNAKSNLNNCNTFCIVGPTWFFKAANVTLIIIDYISYFNEENNCLKFYLL